MVGDLNTGIELEAGSRFMEAKAELHVLYGSAGEGFAEASGGDEAVLADGATASPKGGGAAIGAMVDKAMEQVTKAADAAGCGGVLIVGAEEGVQGWIIVEGAREAIESVRVDGGIGVKEDEDLARGFGGGGVARGRRTTLDRLTD